MDQKRLAEVTEEEAHKLPNAKSKAQLREKTNISLIKKPRTAFLFGETVPRSALNRFTRSAKSCVKGIKNCATEDAQ